MAVYVLDAGAAADRASLEDVHPTLAAMLSDLDHDEVPSTLLRWAPVIS